MLGLKLIHVSKRGHWWYVQCYVIRMTVCNLYSPVWLLINAVCHPDDIPCHPLSYPDYLSDTDEIAKFHIFTTRCGPSVNRRRHQPHKALLWRHNGRDGVSNHHPHDCLLNRLFGRRSKKTSKLRVTGLCAGNSSGTGEFSAQRASNAENVSIRWRHHG